METQLTGNDAVQLDAGQVRKLDNALAGLASFQLQWVSGYVAGLATTSGHLSSVEQATVYSFKILYGSQTGNGERLSKSLERRLREQGFQVTSSSLADYKPANIGRENMLALVISTHGEGEPPDDAELFHEYLMSSKAPKLGGLRFMVLALGDSSYINFCKTGREFDARLAELGGERFLPLTECDLDYQDEVRSWGDLIIGKIPELPDIATTLPNLRAVEPLDSVARYDKQHPFLAEVLVNQKLTGSCSSKDVRHIELSVEGSDMCYEPGDSLAVVVDNPQHLIRQILHELSIEAGTQVTVQGKRMRIADALATKLEITALGPSIIEAWARHSDSSALRELSVDLSGSDAKLSGYLETHQLIDMLRMNPANVDAQTLANSLRKLNPRLYSIASSQAANPGEVHLTVAPVRYQAFGSDHWGAASTQLTDRLAEGDHVSVYIEANSRFRLPPDDDAAIIMIGSGTGVAPFRAFIEERAERQAGGKNWLFFGERNFSSDFLYQLEWQRFLQRGQLDRLDVAFSRDQAEKIYVQDRIQQSAKDLHSWIADGAYIYVCGDARLMAVAVDNALIKLLSDHGGETEHQAQLRLKEMRRSRRYQRDVY